MASDLPYQEDRYHYSEKLKKEEQALAKKVSLGRLQWVLIISFLLWLISMVLPFTSTGIRGFDILTIDSAARGGEIRITEYVYVFLISLGAGLGNLLLILSKRTYFSWITWMFSCVGTFYVVLALWLRQTTEASPSGTASLGMYLSILPIVMTTITTSMIILKRNPQQLQLAEKRKENNELDYVGANQMKEFTSHNNHDWDTNPLLVDDRRAQTRQRHKPGSSS